MLKEELRVIKQAIMNEVEGFEFYRMAAKQAGEGGSRDAFLELASEEKKHIEYLEALFVKIKDGIEDEKEMAFMEGPPSPGIYKWDKLDKDLTSLAMSVFSIGIQMEKDSVDFYTKAKEETEIEQARKLYDTLIKWERVHLEQFTEQYNMYKEDWWSDQGFAPF